MNNIPFTKEGLAKIQLEYDTLTKERPDAVSHLKRARELGDLSENGYYKASRAKLNQIDSRLRYLQHLLKNSTLIEEAASDTVELGVTVTVDNGEEERKFLLVGGFESDPLEGKISHISPLGKALLGAKTGETRVVSTPKGRKEYKILAIE